ncbi:MAG: hypothetical protein IPJ39_19805 [Saprospiraceae bacterium]|nr:hypothetical protein [Saprospiraceae bacterium]
MELYALSRLSFSMLTASDYLASSQYMNGNIEPLKDFGILTKARILELFKFVNESDVLKNGKPNYNKSTYQKLLTDYKLQNPQEQSGDNLNILRQEMALEIIQNIRHTMTKTCFT